MVVKRYFHVQQLAFNLCGIDTKATKPELILKRPYLCFVPLFFAISHDMTILHYAYVNRQDYVELTDSLSLVCQSLLSIWKLLIFLMKRRQFVALINDIHLGNFSTLQKELPLVVAENQKDVRVSTLYFRAIGLAVVFAFGNPLIDALYAYYTTGELVLRVPYKASYFWSHTQLPGYSLVYIWCALSIYNLVFVVLAIDTTFMWLVSNITAQFHILTFRFNEAALAASDTPATKTPQAVLEMIKSCLKHHKRVMDLAKRLNQIYGEILFVKFLISCTQICCLAFRLSRPSESLSAAVYQGFFLSNVAMQLMLYCYNGQRIINVSSQVANDIYLAFDWSCLTKVCKKLLLQTIMRAQKSTELKAVFFVLDLNLFLWAFKTAGSLITALKTLDENQ